MKTVMRACLRQFFFHMVTMALKAAAVETEVLSVMAAAAAAVAAVQAALELQQSPIKSKSREEEDNQSSSSQQKHVRSSHLVERKGSCVSITPETCALC